MTMLLTKQVNISTTPVYWANKKAFDAQRYRVIANEGSSRSSKTYSEMQLLIEIANGGMNLKTGLPYTKKEISVVAVSLPHLKKGALKDFLTIMNDLGIYDEEQHNKTDQVYTFDKTGSYIEFFSADNAGKVRGPGRDILLVNEANLIEKAIYQQLAIRTTETIFIDYNPADEFSYVYDLADAIGNKKIHSTYLNNKANLSKWQIDEIESYREADENFWKVFGLGLRGTSTETIYTHWKYCDEMPRRGVQVCGQDFGFNNPSALVDIEIYENAVYLDELIYQSKLTTNDLIEAYKTYGIENRLIYCDSAEPKTIEEIQRAGYAAKPAIKDVYVGIQKLKSMPLYITRRSANIIKEIKSYKWQKDKQDKVLDVPVKLHDHAMDAARYGVMTYLAEHSSVWSA
jgi:phage terminase large subunit